MAPSAFSRNCVYSDHQGTRVLGDHCSWPRALAPRTWLLGSSGNSGAQGPLFMAPSTLSRNLVFLDLVEIIPKGGATWHSAVLASGLGDPRFPYHRRYWYALRSTTGLLMVMRPYDHIRSSRGHLVMIVLSLVFVHLLHRPQYVAASTAEAKLYYRTSAGSASVTSLT